MLLSESMSSSYIDDLGELYALKKSLANEALSGPEYSEVLEVFLQKASKVRELLYTQFPEFRGNKNSDLEETRFVIQTDFNEFRGNFILTRQDVPREIRDRVFPKVESILNRLSSSGSLFLDEQSLNKALNQLARPPRKPSGENIPE